MNYKEFIRIARDGIPDEMMRSTQASLEPPRPEIEVPASSTRKTPVGKDYVQEALLDKKMGQWGNSFGEKSRTTMSNSSLWSKYSFNNGTSPELLVNQYKDEILHKIEANNPVILKGCTGSGKTTMVPVFVLEHCFKTKAFCNIVVTQPRKIAAVSVARRVCIQRGWPVGSLVGHQVSLFKEVGPDTRLTYCTPGLLLQKLIKEKSIGQYSHIFIDEVHERDLNNDFLLIILRRCLALPDCTTKVILMSATIDTQSLVRYFARNIEAPSKTLFPSVIALEEKPMFKIHTFYLESIAKSLSIEIDSLELDEENLYIRSNFYLLAHKLIKVFRNIENEEQSNSKGTVLVFLPGIFEIETFHDILTRDPRPDEIWDIHPLHSTITTAEQMCVFSNLNHDHRRIVLATNMAESSLTLPNVKYVIDFCLTRVSVQAEEASLQYLDLQWASKSQLRQRAGRSGRVMEGRVYRLISEEIYNSLPEQAAPEMLRAPLESVVLKAKTLYMGPPKSILGQAMDPPDLKNIYRTVLSLKQLGALLVTCDGEYVEDDGDLTFAGYFMACLPMCPHLSKLILLGSLFGLEDECIIIASAMSVKSMFSTPFKRRFESYSSKLDWADNVQSDPIAFLKAYRVWREKRVIGVFSRAGGTDERKWADRFFLQVRSLKEIAQLELEINSRLRELGLFRRDDTKLKWTNIGEDSRLLVLKFILSGACYPNYFLRKREDEETVMRTLCGRNPLSTVYLTGFPNNQPGALYVNFIKEALACCGSDIKVSFDSGGKVFITFGNSDVSNLSNCDADSQVMVAVYRAVKMRYCNKIPISIPVMLPTVAAKKARELELQTSNPYTNPVTVASEVVDLKPERKFVSVQVTNILCPNKFWVQLRSSKVLSELKEIHMKLNDPSNLIPLTSPGINEICVAPFIEDGNKAYYRAKILKFIAEGLAKVFFIDYGNSEDVKVSDLRGFSKEISSLRKLSPLAFQCYLSQIQPPVLSKGRWSMNVCDFFKSEYAGQTAVAKIYSMVNQTLSLFLFPERDKSYEELGRIPYELSFNQTLIDNDYAVGCEEPYLSRVNHSARQSCYDGQIFDSFPALTNEDGVNIEPPKLSECPLKVPLKGPKSPLETKLISMTQRSAKLKVSIDQFSVNSVLLDSCLMDPHERMLVAESVACRPNSDELVLRNTTMLPNIHGLHSLIILTFATNVELRTDPQRTRLTGALCGLGYNEETNDSYNPDNDIELTFDTHIGLEDIESVNKIRYYIGQELYRTFYEYGNHTLSQPAFTQKEVLKYLLEILTMTRSSVQPMHFSEQYKWSQIDELSKISPWTDITKLRKEMGFPLISGVRLRKRAFTRSEIYQNLKDLRSFVSGENFMLEPTMCFLCSVKLMSVSQLNQHIQSLDHKMKESTF